MRRLQISLLEFNYHPEVLRSFCKISEGLDIDLHIYTRARIWKYVHLYEDDKELPDNIKLKLLVDNSLAKFISNNLNQINGSDILIFNTLASDFSTFLRFQFKPNTVLRIHNSNAYFGTLMEYFSLKLDPLYLWKDFSHFVRNTIYRRLEFNRRKFVENIDYFAFTTEEIRQYALEKFELKSENTVVLPFSFITEKSKSGKVETADKIITCGIIGRVDKRNRDYQEVVEAVKKYVKEDSKTLKLILLGSAAGKYGNSIVQQLKQLQGPRFILEYFETYIDQDTFNNKINELDYIIVPVVQKTRYTVYTEYYGLTKISGSINDIITFRKPGIVKDFYPLDQKLESICFRYHDAQSLYEAMLSWSDRMKLDELDVDEALSEYKLDSVRLFYNRQFKKIMGEE
ncbi:hypothetical protein GYB22_00420 [bacterium]|nr:hypothetical protein [bacterium]